MSTPNSIKLFVDASPMAEERLTGIPHFTAELVRALDAHPDNGRTFQLVLLIAFDKRKRLDRWHFGKTKIRSIPLPMRLLNLLWKYRLLPPMDLLFGSGAYLFPNYKNWPLARSLCLTYIHDLGYLRFPQYVQPKNLTFLRQGMQRWVKRSDLILTGSNHAKQEIEQLLHVPKDRVVRIYHGVEHGSYYPRNSHEVAAAKERYGITGNYILHIGSFEPRKNLVNLINAYRSLPQRISQQYALCLIGGGGWLNESIFKEIDKAQKEGLSVIRPDKYVPDEDMPALISGAALLVHPAVYEGFGLPPLQAMACGVPVVVANNSSLPEVVGKAGLLFDANNTSDISDKIVLALQNDSQRSHMIAAGKKQALKFSWEISADELVSSLMELRKNA